jgi:hypothetical protein
MKRVTVYTRRMAFAYETETPHATRTKLGPYREADYLELPDQPRCELLYGRLPVTPASTVRHRRVVVEVLRLLREFAGCRGGYAVVSPVDVGLAEGERLKETATSRSRAGSGSGIRGRTRRPPG